MKKRISDLLDGCGDNSVELDKSTPLSPARIKALTMSRISPKQRRPHYILGTLSAAAACVGLIFLMGQAFWGAPSGEEPRNPYSAVEVSPSTGPDIGHVDGAAGCDTLPGDFEPVLCLNGTYYRWAGMSVSSTVPYRDENGNLQLRTYLPEGFKAAGDISVISHIIEVLPQELEMQAGFDAAGTVYANPERPAVVYVLMSTDWFEDSYVRFTADCYESGLIRFNGRLYWFAYGTRAESEHLREFPEGCVSAGTLHVVDKDLIPAGQLEVNFSEDCYGHSLEGREVFYDPADNSVIYLYEEQSWREGSYPAWVACHLWPGGSD